MFISAKMISLTNLKPLDYLHELDAFSFDISVAGAAACCIMLVLLIVTKRFKRMPQRITFCLVLSQVGHHYGLPSGHGYSNLFFIAYVLHVCWPGGVHLDSGDGGDVGHISGTEFP